MACARAFSLCLLANSVATQMVTEEDRSSIMRRQKSSSQVHLGPRGDMHLHEDLHQNAEPHKPKKLSQAAQAWFRVTNNGKHKVKGKQPGELSWCDTSYPLGTPDSNACIDGDKILREEDCRHAGGVLNVTLGSPNFIIRDDWVNPNPYSKGCFKFNNTVYFNPTESVRTSGWQGTPICTLAIYTNGTAETDSSAGCTGDYEPITSYSECEWAHDCQWGGMFCQDQHFGNDLYSTTDAPKGCYRNALGCYGFNANTATPDDSWNFTSTQPVCRLKSHTYNQAAGGSAH